MGRVSGRFECSLGNPRVQVRKGGMQPFDAGADAKGGALEVGFRWQEPPVQAR